MVKMPDFTRRGVLRTGALALGLSPVRSAASGEELTDTGDAVTDTVDTDELRSSARQIPPANMTGVETQLIPVAAANANVPERALGIRPGSQLFIDRADSSETAGCTANFVWQGANSRLYLGTAGHCLLPSNVDADQNAGGSYDSSKVMTRVCLDCISGAGGGKLGLRGKVMTLGNVVYARQAQDGNQIGNDFGLVEIPEAAHSLVTPKMPTFGGPTKKGTVNRGEKLCYYGNGVAVGETFVTKGRTGIGISNNRNKGWWRAALAVSPGDSGSPVQGCRIRGTRINGAEAAGLATHIATPTGAAGTTVAKAKKLAEEASLNINPVVA